MMLQAIEINEKKRFLHAPLPLAEKSSMNAYSGNGRSIILLRNGDHEPPVKILPNTGPGIVASKRQMQSPPVW
jgi:hypothetical protein